MDPWDEIEQFQIEHKILNHIEQVNKMWDKQNCHNRAAVVKNLPFVFDSLIYSTSDFCKLLVIYDPDLNNFTNRFSFKYGKGWLKLL